MDCGADKIAAHLYFSKRGPLCWPCNIARPQSERDAETIYTYVLNGKEVTKAEWDAHNAARNSSKA